MKKIEDHSPEFWEGKENIFVRLLTYSKVGVNQLNDYKYVGATIFGLYYTFKLENPIWLFVMVIISLPLILLLGRWWLHKGAKSSEYVTTQKGTVLGYGAYNAQIEIVDRLDEIIKLLKDETFTRSR